MKRDGKHPGRSLGIGSGPRGGLTPEERKDRYWGEEHNRRRRKAYGSGTAERARDSYRERAGVFVDDPRLRLDRLMDFGSVREVNVDDEWASLLTFTPPELAKLLGRSGTAVATWITEERLPKPPTPCRPVFGWVQYVYLEPGVRAIALVLGAHFNNSLRYGPDDVETRDALYKALGHRAPRRR